MVALQDSDFTLQLLGQDRRLELVIDDFSPLAILSETYLMVDETLHCHRH